MHRLLQPTRGAGRRRRPGLFRVTRPDELSHIDMTKVWSLHQTQGDSLLLTTAQCAS
jgi:hypothetical protein